MRGGGGTPTASDEIAQAAVAADDAVANLTVQEVVSGVIFAAVVTMEGSRSGALCGALLSALLTIRLFNPVAAVSIASYLQSVFRLHDEFKALVLCAPLAFLPLAFAKVAAGTAPLLIIFFVGSTLLALAMLGVFKDVLMPHVTGVHPVSSDGAVLVDTAGRESRSSSQHQQTRAIMAAVSGLALVALLLGQDVAFIILSGVLTQQLLKFRSLEHLQCPLVALSVYVAARVVSILKFGDGSVLLRRLSTSDGDGVGHYFSQQARAICAALILKMWAGFSLSFQDGFASAIFAAASLTTAVANHIDLNPKPIFKRFGQKSGMLIDDRMPRWPGLTAGGLLRGGDWFGTIICAMGGTLSAAERGMDVMGCIIMATVTAVGGGTIRDMFIGHENGVPKRSFWMGEPEYLLIVFVTCICTFSFWNPVAEYLQLSTDDSWEFWSDAVGMGSFTCVGTMNGIRAGLPVPIVAMCGMFSASFGGLTRDVISRHPVRIMHAHKDMYAFPAYVGSLAYQTVRSLGLALRYRIAAGVVTTVMMRYYAWTCGWRMPVLNAVYQHKSKPVQLLQPMGTRKTRAAALDPSCDLSSRPAPQSAAVRQVRPKSARSTNNVAASGSPLPSTPPPGVESLKL